MARELPVAHSVVLSPVPRPGVVAGQDARLGLAACYGALDQANGRLVASRNIYSALRQRYAGVK